MFGFILLYLMALIILLATFLLFITTIKFIYKPSEYYSKMEFVYFDENDIVVSTSLKESLEFYVP